MENIILSKKLEYELRWLYDAYTRGSKGLMYIPTADDDTLPKKSFIRLKRLVSKNMAIYVGDTCGHPTYSITKKGIEYAHTHTLPKV